MSCSVIAPDGEKYTAPEHTLRPLTQLVRGYPLETMLEMEQGLANVTAQPRYVADNSTRLVHRVDPNPAHPHHPQT